MDLIEFATSLYDVMGMNIPQGQFFDKYVKDDDAFMVFDEGYGQVILMDDYKIKITRR